MSLNKKLSKEQWEEILNSVDKTRIPLDCLRKVTIKLVGRKQKTINVGSLIKQGMTEEEIEAFLSRKVDEYGDDVVTLDFFVDIDRVSQKVQDTTDQLLSNL